eukprot:199086_1
MSDQKYELKEDNDLSDEETEVVVNDADLRDKAHNLVYKLKNYKIIDCIGKLSMIFMDQYGSKKEGVGTAVAYRTSNGITNLLTCAHNVRLRRYHCKACKQLNKAKTCPTCASEANSVQEILKADSISFEIRNLKTGEQENKWDCNIDNIYLDDFNYANYPKPSDAFDIAVLSIRDDGYFADKTENILLVNGMWLNELKQENMPYYIFGYPYEVKGIKRKEMWGNVSIKHKYTFDNNNQNDSYFKQNEIDTSVGQSGSPIFTVYQKYVLIFAVHVGGRSDLKYNIGTLMHKHVEAEGVEIKDLDYLIQISKKYQVKPFDKPTFELEWQEMENSSVEDCKANEVRSKGMLASLNDVKIPFVSAFKQNHYDDDIISLYNSNIQQLKNIEQTLKPKMEQLQQQEEKINNKTFKIERCCPGSKVVVCIGPTGYGKSLVCNRLHGYGEDIDKLEEKAMFKVGKTGNIHSETKDLVKHSKDVLILKYMDNRKKVSERIKLSVIDTPGAFDSDGDDVYIQNCMKKFFGYCGGINMFCIFFKFGSKCDDNYKTLLKSYSKFWGDSFWKHCVVIITNCDIDSKKLKNKLEKAREDTVNGIKFFLEKVSDDKCRNIDIFEFGEENFEPSRLDLLLKLEKEFKDKYKCNAITSPMDTLCDEIKPLNDARQKILLNLWNIQRELWKYIVKEGVKYKIQIGNSFLDNWSRPNHGQVVKLSSHDNPSNANNYSNQIWQFVKKGRYWKIKNKNCFLDNWSKPKHGQVVKLSSHDNPSNANNYSNQIWQFVKKGRYWKIKNKNCFLDNWSKPKHGQVVKLS